MFPVLLDFGTVRLPWVGEVHLALPTYGALFAASVLLAAWWFFRRAQQLGVLGEPLYNLTFYSLLAGIVGAKVTLVLLDLDNYLAHPAELLGTIRSAGVLIGGIVAGALTFLYLGRRYKLPILALGDAIAAPLAFAQAVGRLGCFSAGCCYGVETHAANPFAVVFTSDIAHAQTGVPLHQPLVATQLLQFANDLVLAGILTWLWRKRVQPPGTVFWTYVLLYSVGRGVIELWRGDVQRGLYFGGLLSTSQLFALAGALLALTMLLRTAMQRRQAASA